MKDLSLHILDIAQNSVVANAKLVQIRFTVSRAEDLLTIEVEDDGKGMNEEMVARVTSPFTTTRTTRKVGLGIPLFKAGAERSGGSFSIRSKVGIGTVVQATYQLSNIDRPPMGDLAGTVVSLVMCNPQIDFVFAYGVDGDAFVFDTREIRQQLGADVPLETPQVVSWMQEYLQEGIDSLNGGVLE